MSNVRHAQHQKLFRRTTHDLAKPPVDEEQSTVFAESDEKKSEITALVPQTTLDELPSRYQKAVEQATMLFRFMEGKDGINY